MAVYHLKVTPVSRGGGRSIVAAAAYVSGSRLREPDSALDRAAHLSGERLDDAGTGKVWDYSRKLVEFRELSLPEGAPGWMADRQALWSAVEQAETRINSRLGREIVVALPRELGRDEQVELVRSFVAAEVTARGMVADWGLHEPVASDGLPQAHAHILTNTRAIDATKATGFGRKVREWDRRDLIVSWRDGWQREANAALEMAGRDERIDGRSVADRFIDALDRGDLAEAARFDREPLPHLGPQAHALERQGVATDIGETLRAIVADHAATVAAYDAVRAMADEVPDAPARFLDLRRETGDPFAAFDRWSGWARETLERAIELAREAVEPVREAVVSAWDNLVAAMSPFSDFATAEREAAAEREAELDRAIDEVLAETGPLERGEPERERAAETGAPEREPDDWLDRLLDEMEREGDFGRGLERDVPERGIELELE